jgi:ZIP family zinc transporter
VPVRCGTQAPERGGHHGSLPIAVAGFAVGFLAVYGFDLFIHRGQLAGKEAQKHKQVERFYHRRRPRLSEVTVLAGGTSAEELTEGLSVGIGVVIKPGLDLLIALAIVIDNLSEGLSIGEIIRADESADRGRRQAQRILGWTGLIGASLFGSALAGWFSCAGYPGPCSGSFSPSGWAGCSL